MARNRKGWRGVSRVSASGGPPRSCQMRTRTMSRSSPALRATADQRSRRFPNVAAMRPHTASDRNATISFGLSIVNRKYGSVKKKSRLMADATAVTSAAVRPPNSATMIVNARNTNARFEADVTDRSGIRAMPSSKDPRSPTAIQISTSSTLNIAVTPWRTRTTWLCPPSVSMKTAGCGPKQRAAQDEIGHTEVDDEAGDVDQRRHQRCGSAGRVEAEAAKDEGQHRASQGAEHDNADEGAADRRRDKRPVCAGVVDAQVLPQHDANHSDRGEDRAQRQARGQLATRDAPPVAGP